MFKCENLIMLTEVLMSELKIEVRRTSTWLKSTRKKVYFDGILPPEVADTYWY